MTALQAIREAFGEITSRFRDKPASNGEIEALRLLLDAAIALAQEEEKP
jgi:hypothetical protein